jgi:hypothetical protein
MKRFVATTVLVVAVSSSVVAGPPDDETSTTQQCATQPVSAYQAISRLGIQVDSFTSGLEHPSMTLTPAQARSLQVGDGVD